jgi:hypothetical protein
MAVSPSETAEAIHWSLVALKPLSPGVLLQRQNEVVGVDAAVGVQAGEQPRFG